MAFHLAGLADDGDALPEPSSLEEVMKDTENRDGVAVLVDAKGGVPKAVRVNITIPEDVLSQIDAHVATSGMNRSGFLVQAAKTA